MKRNGMTEWREVVGVDNVLLDSLRGFEDKWNVIKEKLI